MVRNNNCGASGAAAAEKDDDMEYYHLTQTLTREEMSRMQPCRRVTAKCVMMSVDSPGTQQLHRSIPALNYVELPEEPRGGKITPSSRNNNSTGDRNNRGSATPSEDEVIEEAVPVGRGTLPSPEPKPTLVPGGAAAAASDQQQGNGLHRADSSDRLDGAATLNGAGAAGGVDYIKPPKSYRNSSQTDLPRDINDDSCLIKCVYFTQQCCECVIV